MSRLHAAQSGSKATEEKIRDLGNGGQRRDNVNCALGMVVMTQTTVVEGAVLNIVVFLQRMVRGNVSPSQYVLMCACVPKAPVRMDPSAFTTFSMRIGDAEAS